MAHLAFYRKYRPTKFSEVIGQNHITQTLKNSVKNNMVGNAYIFAGPKGTGKTTIAKIYAKAINCLNNEDGDCCNKCEHCLEIINQTTTDVLELDAASNNGIDEIRKIVNNVKYLPTSLNKKVYIIDEAHMLTTQAWNAMLKTLEEAPEHVVFIFSTTEMHKIPSTIISRCQYFIFNKLNETQINETIERVVKNENIKINADAKKNLINLANGHARDVLTMLEQISMLTDKNITSDDINKIFGLISTENKIKFINLIISGDLNKTLSMFNQYYESGINVDIFFSDIVAILLDKLIHMQTKDATLLKLLNNNNINEIKVDIDNLHTLIDLLGDNMYKIKKEDNVKFYCGQLLIKAHSLFKNNKASEPVVVEKEIKVEVKKDGELPNVSEIFLTKEIKIKKPVETTNKAVTIDDVFFATLSNCNSNLLKQANEYLTKIKGSNDAKLQHFLESNKVLLSSNNSAILLFENNLDAGLLNKTFADSEFIKKIESIINKPMYFIGLTENDFKKRVSEFMSLSNKKFAELSFENPKKQNAKDIFDELLN